MNRLLIIPAAGRGSRLGSTGPKVLHPVAGRPMLDYLLDLYDGRVGQVVLVLHPSFADEVERHCRERGTSVEVALQLEPTGMLPAILLAREHVVRHRPDHVWITWCDQIAVRPSTLDRLGVVADGLPRPAMTMPTVTKKDPYIHFVRDDRGVIRDVLQRREGAVMPDVGEGDSGVFCLTREAYLDDLELFARGVARGAATGEANFLPFIPWLAGRKRIDTFPVEHESEAIGVNAPEDIDILRRYLRARD